MATPVKKEGSSLATLLAAAGRKALADKDASEIPVADPGNRPKAAKIFNIVDYIEAPWGLNMKLYPVQRFIVKLYYNVPLDDVLPEDHRYRIQLTDMFKSKVHHTFTEAEYLEHLYNEGRCNISEQDPDHTRRQLILACGRRSGKSTLAGVFASYEIYRLLSLGNPQKYYGLPQGNRIQIISVATDKEQAGILFNEVTGHVAKCEYFKTYVGSNTQSYVTFRTPYDIDKFGATSRHENGKFVSFNGKASLRLAFKSCIAKGLRGMGNIVIILDEFAHFQVKGQSSAKEIYDAVTPSAAMFSPKNPDNPMEPVGDVDSRIILISSPLNREGKFYEQFQLAMSRGPGSENLLAIQAPTWEINPTVDPGYYKEKYHADPAVFMVEHGALFSERLRGWFEREEDLLACIDPLSAPIEKGIHRVPYFMGIDVGLVGDGTAIAICHLEGDTIVLDYHEIWYAGVKWEESNPHLLSPGTIYANSLEKVTRLDFEEITNWISNLASKFYIVGGLFDRWNGIPLEQALHKKGLSQFSSDHFTKDQKSRMYQTVKLMALDRKLSLYDQPRPPDSSRLGRSPLLREMLNLQATQSSANIITVAAPKLPGAHDDMSDAVVRAFWLASEELRDRKFVAGARGQSHAIAAGPSLNGFNLSRARSHGVLRDRISPKSSLGRRILRRG